MIEQLLAEIRRSGKVAAADCLWRQAERTSVTFESGRLKAAGVGQEAGVNLRVLAGGRIGVAGTTGAGADGLVARALAAAELGEPLELSFPSRTALPRIPTFFDRAANASLDALIAMGKELVERLARDGCQVNVTVEREVGETRVANTAGTDAAYRYSGVAVSAEVWRIAGNDVLAISDAFDGADLPDANQLAAVSDSIGSRLEAALTIVEPPEGSLPVVFTPAGLSAVLLPITQALSGKTVVQGISPLAGKIGTEVFDRAFSLTDDPLRPGRPSSRPVDDEGVPSQVTPLVERGVVRHFIYDLETAARAHTASTGHGTRGIFSKPGVAYTNLIVGEEGREKGEGSLGGGLLADIKDGLLVDDLIGVGQGNVIGGAFSHPVALAYRVVNGEVTGRAKDAAVAGNSYELLKRIGGFGADRRWYGGRSSPSVLLEGVSVARR
ncbi:MAG TPA: TldD/PmbA family protein [Gemmatimonadales bacterium]|nr:TldD/PmbA family protein [Gemmatimonadales bacterium]